MTAALKIDFGETTTTAPRPDADERTAPQVLIDVDAAEIVGANAAGAAAFGIFSYAAYPIAIDPELQGVARLRELAAEIDGTHCEQLMFRTGGRLRSMSFKISKPERTRKTSRILLEIIDDDTTSDVSDVAPSDGAAAPATGITSPSATPEAPPPSAPERTLAADAAPREQEPTPASPPASRNDADTLKQIARRIREGNGVREAVGPRRDTPADTASVSVPPPSSDDVPAPAVPRPYPQRKPLSPLDPDHLARLAHELKTPLTAIAAASEVMRDERLGPMGTPRYLEYASDIHESAHHALDVIASLLSESGKPGDPAARLIALDLNAIVARTVSSVQALAELHHISLAFDADKGQPHVIANPTAVRQILLNLLTNAIKFTPAGGDVRVVTGYLDDGRVFMVVRDTGCGMAGRKLPKDFAQEGQPPARLSTGLGIGLPLVRRLVSEMAAELEIDSAPGKGTVVLIAFGGFARWSE